MSAKPLCYLIIRCTLYIYCPSTVVLQVRSTKKLLVHFWKFYHNILAIWWNNLDLELFEMKSKQKSFYTTPSFELCDIRAMHEARDRHRTVDCKPFMGLFYTSGLPITSRNRFWSMGCYVNLTTCFLLFCNLLSSMRCKNKFDVNNAAGSWEEDWFHTRGRASLRTKPLFVLSFSLYLPIRWPCLCTLLKKEKNERVIFWLCKHAYLSFHYCLFVSFLPQVQRTEVYKYNEIHSYTLVRR